MFSAPADLGEFLAALSQPDGVARAEVRKRQERLTKPPGSLGALEDIAAFLAGWQGAQIRADRIQVVLFAGNHGATKQGISPYPSASEPTALWVLCSPFCCAGRH